MVVESVADVVSGLVVYVGIKNSVKPPDANHPYGHGKAEPIAAVAVGLSVNAAAVAIILQSIHRIGTAPLPKGYTLIVLSGGLIIKELLFRYVSSLQIRSGALLL